MVRILSLFVLVFCAFSVFAQTSLPTNMYADSAYAPFLLGVASGDPTEDGVLIWTHISPDSFNAAPINTTWEVAYDTGFTAIVQTGTYAADSSSDWTILIQVDSLMAYTTYYYRFRATNGNYSRIGRTRTTPAANSSSTNHIRLAVTSCSSVFSGFFNGYKRIAEREDLDAVIHLGDYIYDFVDPDEQVRIPTPYPANPSNKQEWRARHYYYLLDPDLRAARQMHPWIVLWDNHDTDYKASGNLPETSREAFLEYVPIRLPDANDNKRIYRKLSYGNLLDIFIADILLYKDVDNLPSGDPTRLGDVQYNWLSTELQNSTAKWKIVGNQKMMGDWSVAGFSPLVLPALQALGFGTGGVLTTSTWDGYDAARDRFLRFLDTSNIDNVLVLSGDSHVSMATDLSRNPFGNNYNGNTGAGSVAVEFLPTSISRGNFDEMGFPNWIVGAVKTYTDASNPHHVYSEIVNHGYGVLDIKTDSTRAEFWYSNILTVTSSESYGHGILVKDSENHWHRTPMAAPSDPKDYSSTLVNVTAAQQWSTAASKLQLQVQPNPSEGKYQLSFELKKAEQASVNIVDLATGRVLKRIAQQKFQRGRQQLMIDISELAAGSYGLSFEGNRHQAGKILVKY